MAVDFTHPPDAKKYYAAIWEIVRQIPTGKVASYGQVASFIPCPEGIPMPEYEAYRARWAGQAMAESPADVPWQRVINSQGKISLKTDLQVRQRRLLEAEGVTFDDRDRVDMARYGWSGPDPAWLQEHGFLPRPETFRQESLF